MADCPLRALLSAVLRYFSLMPVAKEGREDCQSREREGGVDRLNVCSVYSGTDKKPWLRCASTSSDEEASYR